MRDTQKIQWLGSSPELRQHAVQRRATEIVRQRYVGLGEGGVAVATSGWIAPVVVLGILGLAIYGGIKAVGKLPAGR